MYRVHQTNKYIYKNIKKNIYTYISQYNVRKSSVLDDNIHATEATFPATNFVSSSHSSICTNTKFSQSILTKNLTYY